MTGSDIIQSHAENSAQPPMLLTSFEVGGSMAMGMREAKTHPKKAVAKDAGSLML